MITVDLFESDFNKKPANESMQDDMMRMIKDLQASGKLPATAQARIRGTPDQERERTQQIMTQRAKERAEQDRQAAVDDARNLLALKTEYKKMKDRYKSLGGSNWQYADREQNLSDREREARSMEPALNTLAGRIARAEAVITKGNPGVAEGKMGEIADAYEDYKKLSPREFYNMYRMTKEQWFAKYGSLVKEQANDDEERQALANPPVRSRELGMSNFNIINQGYAKDTPFVKLPFGTKEITIDAGDMEAIANYYSGKLTRPEQKWNFIYAVLNDPDNFQDFMRRIGRRVAPPSGITPQGPMDQGDLFYEAKKKDDEEEPTVKDVGLQRAISQAKADFPTAGSGLEALAKDFIRSQEQDQKTFDQLRSAERRQADLLSQINRLDQRQDQEIDDLERSNTTLSQRIQQLQSINSQLEKKLAGMSTRPAKVKSAEPAEPAPAGTPTVAQPTAAAEPVAQPTAQAQPAAAVKPAVSSTIKTAVAEPEYVPDEEPVKRRGGKKAGELSQSPDAVRRREKRAADRKAAEKAKKDAEKQAKAAEKKKAKADAQQTTQDYLDYLRGKGTKPVTIPSPEPVMNPPEITTKGAPEFTAETRKKSKPAEVDYNDPKWDAMVRRVGQLAKAGPMKTVWDPEKRVYKNVPVTSNKKDQGIDEGADNAYGYQVGQQVELNNGQQGQVLDIFDSEIEVLLPDGRTVTVDFRDARVLDEDMRVNRFSRSPSPPSEILSVQDRQGIITVKVKAHDGTPKSFSNSNPMIVQRWLDKYGLKLPRKITDKFVYEEPGAEKAAGPFRTPTQTHIVVVDNKPVAKFDDLNAAYRVFKEMRREFPNKSVVIQSVKNK